MMSFEELEQKARWVRRQTIMVHGQAPESRVASSLSAVEIFVVLYYGGLLRHYSDAERRGERDRFIISKGHGSISLYPVLADLGYFDKKELSNVNRGDSLLTAIPDAGIPGYETTNGALGHGLGVACGIALALKTRRRPQKVFVLCGDGELNEGSIWEAVMFAAFHKLENLILIVDNNRKSMLGCQREILGLEPMDARFAGFGWRTLNVDGHNISETYEAIKSLREGDGRPAVLIAETVKGKGVPSLESDPLSHIRSLNSEQIAAVLEELE